MCPDINTRIRRFKFKVFDAKCSCTIVLCGSTSRNCFFYIYFLRTHIRVWGSQQEKLKNKKRSHVFASLT
jgi:hypothetical protein